jgi:hypothetical protein
VRRPALLAAAALCGIAAAAGCAHRSAPAAATRTALRPFGSEEELARYRRELGEELQRRPRLSTIPTPPLPPHPPGEEPPPPPPPPSAPEPLDFGLPNGPLARVHGDHLVILWRGGLSAVRIAGGALEPEPAVDALPPGIGPGRIHYEEILVAGENVALTGSAGPPRETAVTLFRLGADGRPERRAGYRLRAGGNYGENAHATGVAGGKLVFYDRLNIPRYGDPSAVFPAIRRVGGADTAYRRTEAASRVYRPVRPLGWDDEPVLHALTVCDPEPGELDCRSTGVYGVDAEAVQLSPGALYLWTLHRYVAGETDTAMVYRLPLDGSAPSAVRASGDPQGAFLESGDGHLNVFVTHGGFDRRAWSQPPSPALVRVPLGRFGDGSRTTPRADYRFFPRAPGMKRGRFVGEWLLYGNRPFSDYAASTGLFEQPAGGGLGVAAVRWAAAGEPAWLPLGRGVEAIEPFGPSAAVVLATEGGRAHLEVVRLGERPEVAQRIPAAAVLHREGRITGFAYRADGEESGVLGITVGERTPDGPRPTAVVYFRHDSGRLRALGTLAPSRGPLAAGGALPLFAPGRIFAVFNGELVEAVEEDGRLREVHRLQLPPRVDEAR